MHEYLLLYVAKRCTNTYEVRGWTVQRVCTVKGVFFGAATKHSYSCDVRNTYYMKPGGVCPVHSCCMDGRQLHHYCETSFSLPLYLFLLLSRFSRTRLSLFDRHADVLAGPGRRGAGFLCDAQACLLARSERETGTRIGVAVIVVEKKRVWFVYVVTVVEYLAWWVRRLCTFFFPCCAFFLLFLCFGRCCCC